MTTLSSIAEVVQSLARRNKLHAKIALGMLVILGLFGVRLLNVAGPQRQVVLVGGGLLITMILLLYTVIRNLRKQMEMVVALLDRIQEQTTMERLVGQVDARAGGADTGDGPLKDILKLAQGLDKRQRRNFIATTVGLLAGIAGVILGSSYVDVKKSSVGVAVRAQEPQQGASEPERVHGLTPQQKEETQPSKDEPKPGSERKLQAGGETQQANRAATQAMQEPRVDPEQLVALRRQVGALRQELSATRQKLQEERKNAALPEEGPAAHGKGPDELQRRIEELEGTSAEQDYVRLVNEALAYTYRNNPGDAERAETAYRNAIRIAQDKGIRDPVVYNAYAAFLQEQSKFREAEQFYQMALKINPRYGPALYNLGSLYELTGRPEEALKKYKAADEAGEKLGAQRYQRLQS
ncbi:MAG: tetratricopeptide repeat protein, partial [Acidobacteria bacterium]|nr:tetratricopeptide repeat protein [Acidobacteriota bacterium]